MKREYLKPEIVITRFENEELMYAGESSSFSTLRLRSINIGNSIVNY